MNVRVDGNTKLFTVIGDPIFHSLSPQIHNTLFDEMGLNSLYIPMKIEQLNLAQSIPVLKNNFEGFNVTIPHKQKIIKYLDELDKRAEWYRAVNTVKKVDGKLIGYNTDGYGFMKSLEIEGVDINERRILVVGAGGAARVVAYELLVNGGYLTIANRTVEKALALKKELVINTGIDNVEVCSLDDVKEGYYIVVNATPVGMYPRINDVPLDKKVLRGTGVIYDLIYNPYRTKLLQYGEESGCKVINGFSMLFYQAVKSEEIWTGKTLDDDVLFSVYKDIETYFCNR